jgi:hypothetical protein
MAINLINPNSTDLVLSNNRDTFNKLDAKSLVNKNNISSDLVKSSNKTNKREAFSSHLEKAQESMNSSINSSVLKPQTTDKTANKPNYNTNQNISKKDDINSDVVANAIIEGIVNDAVVDQLQISEQEKIYFKQILNSGIKSKIESQKKLEAK